MSEPSSPLKIWSFREVSSALNPTHKFALTDEPCPQDTDSVLYTFPGYNVSLDETGELPENATSNAKHEYWILQNIVAPLENTSHSIQLVSYPNPGFMPDVWERANDNTDLLSPEFITFTREHILPRIKEGKTTTLLGYSVGTSAIEMVERSAIHLLKKEGKTHEEIAAALASVVAVHLGSVNAHVVKDEASPQFTTVLFNNLQDEVAQAFNPAFSHVMPAAKRPLTSLSIHKQGKTTIVSTDYKTFFPYGNHSYWWKAEDFDWENVLEVYSGNGHRMTQFMERNSAVQSGAVLAFERVIRNAVGRNGVVDAQALLENEPSRLPANHRFSAANAISREALDLKDALWEKRMGGQNKAKSPAR